MRRLSLATRLTLGFLVVLIITAGVGGVGMLKISDLSAITRQLYDHPFTVRSSLLYARGDIHAMRSHIFALLYDEQDQDVEQLVDQLTTLDIDAKKRLELAGERYLGPKQDFAKLTEVYREWSNGAFNVVRLVREGKRAEALRLHRLFLVPQSNKLADATDTMIGFAFNRASRFMEEAVQERGRSLTVMAALLVLALAAGVTVSLLVIRSITRPVQHLMNLSRDLALGRDLKEQLVEYQDEIGQLETSFNAIISSTSQVVEKARIIAGGIYNETVELRSDDDTLGKSLQKMTRALAERERESQAENWLKSGQNRLGESMRTTQDTDVLAVSAIGFLAESLHSQVGCLYLFDERVGMLRLEGTYAAQGAPAELAMGEGLVGQAAADRRTQYLADLPADYLRVVSAVGDTPPRHLLISPFFFGERLVGVVEIASLSPYSELDQEFLSRACTILGSGFNIALARREMQRLLQTTLQQAQELRDQQEEMAVINEELQEQAEALRVSEELLKEQQEELRATNEELEEKTQDLELQRENILRKNRDLEDAQRELEQQAHDLETASRYKSDFLANMSHELRTPLNSLLILARDLVENRGGNLTPQQIESAEVIHRSGIDLLNLINDILDLAKIEAGRMDLFEETVEIADVADALKGRFIPPARKKGIELHVAVEEGTPANILTDRQRLEQVLNNLVSNAVKFTEKGKVEVTFSAAPADSVPGGHQMVVTVRDTGIGIPTDKLSAIFESFKQAESGTSRRYGGTGLGLAIARNLAGLLGGTIEVESTVGAGSTFTLRLLLEQPTSPAVSPTVGAPGGQAPYSPPSLHGAPPVDEVDDDRSTIAKEDRTILIIEDDPVFAATLREVCRGMSFKAICAVTGEEGLLLTRQYLPAGVILDLRLPGMSGWQVLETLKADMGLRHIPVHIISCDDPSHEAFSMGAVGFLTKPASRSELERSFQNLEKVMNRRIKELLLVEDDDNLRCSIERLIAHDDIVVTGAPTGEAALAALREKTFDCMVLDLGLPDMSGFELLKRLRNDGRIAMVPVIVYTGRELTREEERELRETSESIIVKGAKSEERLVDETSIFLHRVVSTLNKSQQQYIINLHDRDYYLHDKVVLLVDDDMRNLYALAKVLENRGLKVVKADSGDNAVSILREQEAIDIILMDIMMPGLDGYQTTRTIREMGIRKPVIALTAKAMKEDRDKCLAAGADDYLAKPVDVERLMSMIRVWLYG